MNTCLDCGRDYAYDPSNPLGTSSLRCCACRKKESLKNKKLILINIASNGDIRCRRCGYNRSDTAIVLMDTKSYLNKATTNEEKEKRARSQYVLCLNCESEVKTGQIEAQIVDTKVYPVRVNFYEREVRIIRKEITQAVTYSDTEECEITDDEPRDARQVGQKARAIGGPQDGMPDMPNQS